MIGEYVLFLFCFSCYYFVDAFQQLRACVGMQLYLMYVQPGCAERANLQHLCVNVVKPLKCVSSSINTDN